tara:strand:+ start:368 stop:490 length:123 start_codon:yes stop_codon:yes gene_type:complete
MEKEQKNRKTRIKKKRDEKRKDILPVIAAIRAGHSICSVW